MKLSEHMDIVNMLDEEWNLGKIESETADKTCAWIYRFEILSEAEKVIFEKENNKIIGVCGYSNWKSKKSFIRKRWCKTLKSILLNSRKIKNKDGLKQYLSNYSYLPKHLENYFDGEITIIIVDKKHRGKNIGKKMLSKIFEMAKDDKMKNIQILTDESCNYKFYESFDCKKIYEKKIVNKEVTKCGNSFMEQAYIYEKVL